jgi:hypothetical protein
VSYNQVWGDKEGGLSREYNGGVVQGGEGICISGDGIGYMFRMWFGPFVVSAGLNLCVGFFFCV